MTLQGAIAELRGLIKADDVPFYYKGGISKVIETIQMDAVEVRHGKWIKTGRWGRVYKCNQCGNYLDFDGVNAGRGSTNFCPNCGAEMEGDE